MLQLQDIVGEVLGRLGRAAQRLKREPIRARRPPEPEVDAARKQARQRAELLGDHQGRMVRQHDAAGPDPDGFRSGRDMGDDNGCRGAGDARHIVMFGDPEPPIVPPLGVGGEIAGIVERTACIRAFGDTDKVEYRQRRHPMLLGLRLEGTAHKAVLVARRELPAHRIMTQAIVRTAGPPLTRVAPGDPALRDLLRSRLRMSSAVPDPVTIELSRLED